MAKSLSGHLSNSLHENAVFRKFVTTKITLGSIIFMVSNDVAESDKSLIININDGSGSPLISYAIRPDANTLGESQTSNETYFVDQGSEIYPSTSGISTDDLVGTYSYDDSFENPDGQYTNFYYSLEIELDDSYLLVTQMSNLFFLGYLLISESDIYWINFNNQTSHTKD